MGRTGPTGPPPALTYGNATISFTVSDYSSAPVVSNSVDTGISISDTIWLQGYNQITTPIQPVSVTYMYFTSNITSTWYIEMGTSQIGTFASSCNTTVDYTIYYYSY